MPRKAAGKRKSTRVKQQSKKIKALDSSARDRALRKRLSRLEEDNYKEDVDLRDAEYVDGEEEDIIPTSGSRKKKKGKKPRKRVKLDVKSLDVLTREAKIDYYPQHIPTLLSITAAPPKYPPPNICSVSGFKSKYRCRTCGMLYSSIHTYFTHKETRCLCWKVF